jgi:Zierdtviridae DNA polymerase
MGLNEEFNEFHRQNPFVYDILVKLAKEWLERFPNSKCGISMLYETARWRVYFETNDPEYKINNNYRAHYSRLIMRDEPGMEGLFNIRTSTADKSIKATTAKDHDELLRFWLTQGWKYRRAYNLEMQADSQKYKERMQYEYGFIRDLGFTEYFLMVSDLVRWAKDSGIAVGPGRGSAVASLSLYLLRVTEIDPMQYPMLFERFISPDRTDLPDIDVDFEPARREEVFAYAAKKYGQDCVANIGTFTKYRGKNSLDDIARVYRIPAWKIDAFKAKLIERADGHPRVANTLEDTINQFHDISELVDETPELNYAPQLEGNIRTFGVHAAGLVVSSKPLSEITATYSREIANKESNNPRQDTDKDTRQSIAFDKYDATYLGLLKIDILGLTTMGTIAEICRLAGITLEELYRIPLDDKEVWEAFQKGDVLGIFQFEGTTTRRILKAVAPHNILELSDVNALSRPGANDAAYIKARQGGLQAQHGASAHSVLDRHLSRTYGQIVYEEQILQILRDLGGFPPESTNRIRKVIHDKLGSTAFNEYFEEFAKGALTQGCSRETALEIWEGMVNASGYAFNIAHSISYSVIGYWLGYLKTKYLAEFFTGQLRSCDDDVKRGKFIQDAQRHGIVVKAPELLASEENWSLRKGSRDSIIAGFSAIPGVGPKTSEAIIEWRNEKAEYESINGSDEYGPLEWEDLKEVKGIGDKTIQTIKNFVNAPDPFGVNEVQRILDEVRYAISSGELPTIPTPTHISLDIPKDRQLVCWVGIVRKRKYYDAAEQMCKREVDLTYEQALEKLEDRHLLKYAALYCEDEYGEQVVVRISRWRYQEYMHSIRGIKIDRDIVVVEGYSSDFQGCSIQTKRLLVLEP